ncbi:methyltransferase [Lachnospiraceae bacterium OttesenSCG-928-D06]|nr:methyltransferase [Lachnospiraceae bacterium OttesenSCG-928-D06]
MLKECWQNILQDIDVRQNLSKIREIIRETKDVNLVLMIIKDEEDKLINLLESEDAKTRKNAALLMGDLKEEGFLTPIWQAYEKESMRFIKSSYLSAIGKFDYGVYVDKMKEQLLLLQETKMTEESQKHITEEMRELSALILRLSGVKKRKFTGWDESYQIVLLTNRNFTENVREELLDLIPDAVTKNVGAGVMANVPNLRWVRELRTYQELLFIIPGIAPCKMEVEEIANKIIQSKLFSFLEKSHEGKAPYYFRLEMKSKRDLGEKSIFLKKLSSRIELLSNRNLINTKENYEIELRLIENKQGNCNIMVKLFTLRDNRFTYRKDFLPTSIKPVNAALVVSLSQKYMKEDAQVLDPFCGVGTMLIERHKAVRANTTYGIDILEEAIVKARDNTDIAKQVIHYINKDFFTFSHDYLFDEIITNMPFSMGRFTESDVYDIYEKFFLYAPKLLKKGALVILYTHNRGLVRQMIEKASFRLLEEYEVSRKNGCYVMTLRYTE